MNDDDRVLNRRGRRHFRRTYSVTEVKLGAATALVLLAIAAWVAWRGRHPDPDLSRTAADLMEAPAAPVGRGALPAGLAPDGWEEKGLASFDPSNLYVKIDGRESYYKGFGFVRLDFVSLVSRANAEVYADLELYELQRVDGAIGAMSGEVPKEGKTALEGQALVFRGRSSVLLAKGRFYARVIGASESEDVRAALEHASRRLLAELPGDELPAGFALFVGLLGLTPDRVGLEGENAFSFAFARDVHVGKLPDDAEIFAMGTADPDAAKALAERFRTGFLEYGEDGGREGGVSFVRDRYLHTFAGAVPAGSAVVGVRGAADRKKALLEIERVRGAVEKLPAGALKARAVEKEVAPDEH